MAQLISKTQAKDILKNSFNLVPSEIKSLDSYWDQNFYVKVDGKEYVLKITKRDSTKLLDFQNKMMQHLHLRGFLVPQVISSQTGLEIISQNNFRIRLITYLPGHPVVSDNFDLNLLKEIGKLMAQMDLALQDFSHPNEKREFIWDLKCTSNLRKYLSSIKELDKREVVGKVITEFETKVIPKRAELRAGVTHNDFNEYNILSDGKKLTGIIDFGDALHTYYVNNLAVSQAHFMMRQKEPLIKGAALYSGYQEVFPLQETEQEVLPILIKARLATLITMSSYIGAQEPDNTYVLQQIELAWNILRLLLSLTNEEILKKFI